MKYNEQKIKKIYDDNLIAAYELLASLPITSENKPAIGGLNGWIFEQTIRYCLKQELETLGRFLPIKEQVALCGRAKIDLLVGCAAIEIKARGSFGDDDDKKYSKYKYKTEEKGWVYCYLTLGEKHQPYRRATEAIFGKKNSFFLDSSGDWQRFIMEIIQSNNEKSPNNLLQATRD